RGHVLEEQWTTLDRSFAAIRDGEAEGWRPSLVFTPMVVETGRRLIFSNLDLFGLTEARAVDRDDVSLLPSDRDRVAGDGARTQEIGAGRLYSRTTVEFFRAFPAIYDGPGSDAPADPEDVFKIRTAARMNASFPYISPAVSLPVWPPRRVVDAGFYDNFGVDLALVWAFLNRRWIRGNTSGLALVQIRAFESE